MSKLSNKSTEHCLWCEEIKTDGGGAEAVSCCRMKLREADYCGTAVALTKKVEKRPVVTYFSLVFFVFTVAKLGSGEEFSRYFRGLRVTIKPEMELSSGAELGDKLLG